MFRFLGAIFVVLAGLSIGLASDEERVHLLFQPAMSPSAAFEEEKRKRIFPEGRAIIKDQKVTRRRLTELNPRVAGANRFMIGDLILLNLFEGREHLARVDRVSQNVNGTETFRARMAGSDSGYVLISTTDQRSLGSIRIFETGESYRIESMGGANHSLSEIMEGGVVSSFCGAMAPPSPDFDEPEQRASTAEPIAHSAEHVVVDVMIVYTTAARQWADSSGGGLFNTIAQAMAKANLALENSNTFLSWNLVHSAEVDYTESGHSEADLVRLTISPDFNPFGNTWRGYEVAGHMDEVHQWRDAYGADLVALFASVEDTGGLAWVLDSAAGRPDWGFSLTRVQQAGGTFTHAHEMGHNMGLHHHRDQTLKPGPGLYPYSAGWRWESNEAHTYCSVMTYGSGQYFPDGRMHLQVPHFSNPAIAHGGVATGEPVFGDNARTLREIRHAVAAYRPSVDISIGNALGQSEWEWITGGDASWFVHEAGFPAGGHSVQSGRVGDGQQTWLETTVTGPGILHFWWKISSEPGVDSLRFFSGIEELDRIAGEMNWEQRTLLIPAGTQRLKWLYLKDASVAGGVDAGWLDRVVWLPDVVEPSTFSAWVTGAQLPESLSAIQSDPGGRGIPNWHRYAFGLDPTEPERSRLPSLAIRPIGIGEEVETSYLTITFFKSKAAADIFYRPEASGDLLAWYSIDSSELLVESVGEGNWRRVTYRDHVPVEEARFRSLRVGVLSRLGDAVGESRRDWLTGGNASWLVEKEEFFSGSTSARSGSLSHNQQSWLETSVKGPGVVSFWWKVSSERAWDFLCFSIGSELVTRISGEVGWEERTFLIPDGRHTLRWQYSKDGSISDGKDAGWLDQFVWIPDSESSAPVAE